MGQMKAKQTISETCESTTVDIFLSVFLLGALPINGLDILVTFSFFFFSHKSPIDTVLWAKPLGYFQTSVHKDYQILKN